MINRAQLNEQFEREESSCAASCASRSASAQQLFLHRHPVDALADDLLDLLARTETQLRPTVVDELSEARLAGAKTVINAVCDVIDHHLFKDQT